MNKNINLKVLGFIIASLLLPVVASSLKRDWVNNPLLLVWFS